MRIVGDSFHFFRRFHFADIQWVVTEIRVACEIFFDLFKRSALFRQNINKSGMASATDWNSDGSRVGDTLDGACGD